MSENHLPLGTFLTLLLVASATAVVIKWIKVPYAVALVLAGLAIGLTNAFPPVSMTPELVLMIFLPALLFEASWNLDIRALKRDWLAITVLATVGVLVCMFSVAAILHFAGGMDVQTAMLFGAMVSATDPVSVIALFRQMGIDKRLTMILEGESLFNDGTAVVLFQLVLAIVVAGGQWSLPTAAGSFVFVVLGGGLLGALLGYAASRITSAFDDHLLEITLTMVTAYGGFLLADHLKLSPVITVVAAGIVVGNYGSRSGMSATTRLAVNSFWEYAAFLVNSLLFLMIGLQVQVPLLLKHAQLIGFGVLAVFGARLLVVYGICPFVSTKKLPIPDNWRHLMFWGGLRGALVMALALSLPTTFPEREAIINMTFGVVLFTLLVPGLTMEPLVRILGMSPKQEKFDQYQEYNSLLLAYKAETQAVLKLKQEGKISTPAFESWSTMLQKNVCELETKIGNLHLSDSSIGELQDRQAKAFLLENRKDFFSKLVKEGVLNDDAAHRFYVDVDSELDELCNRHGTNETADNAPRAVEAPFIEVSDKPSDKPSQADAESHNTV